MLNDTTVYVTYVDHNGDTKELQLVLTGQQLEQTMQRRMQTLMPQAKNVRYYASKPDAHQLEMKTGARK